jgi:hypothetical protein
MAALQSVLALLNRAFGQEQIAELAAHREAFGAGKPLAAGLVVKKGTRLYDAWRGYVGQLPPSFHPTLGALIHHALSTDPPTPVTFAWAPGYDYEITIWEVPDTRNTRGGITVLIKSRYPDDKHPVSGSKGSRSARSA